MARKATGPINEHEGHGVTPRPSSLAELAQAVARRQELNSRMAHILRGLEMLSFGTVQAWNPPGGHSAEPDDRVVAQVLQHDDPPYLAFRRRYNRARSDEAREAVIDEAKEELAAIRKRQAPITGSLSLETLIIQDGEGHPAEVVAARLSLHVAFVRRVRVRNDRDPEDGTSPEDRSLSRAERAARIHELHAKGLPQRQIAMVVGCKRITVRRELGCD